MNGDTYIERLQETKEKNRVATAANKPETQTAEEKTKESNFVSLMLL